jgi:hypothetical protein
MTKSSNINNFGYSIELRMLQYASKKSITPCFYLSLLFGNNIALIYYGIVL